MKRFVLFFAVAAIIAAQTATAQTAVIKEMTGTVELQTSAGGNWIPAKEGSTIQKATIVSTGFRSTAILSVGSTTITVRPLTRLTLEEIIKLEETETVNLNLSSGRVRVEVKPPAGSRANFSAQSPSATASVRGTSFEMDTVSIRVLTGGVYYTPVSAAAHSVTVSAGSETRINPETGNAEQPMIMSQILRSLPRLPGETAGTGSDNALLLHSGTVIITVEIGTK
ncbi:MAG: FecR domain-containing protein [Treponema sp.]|jgi:hypothetical protein|nr:FecR domain-containing protein [Treponema sp.]